MSRSRWLKQLDPGIAHYVDVLDAAGIETFESCQGGEDHAFLEPTIRFYGNRGEGFRAPSPFAIPMIFPSANYAAIGRSWMESQKAPTGN